MFDAVQQKFNDYYDQIPPNTLQTVAKSALYSFTVALFIPVEITIATPYNLVRHLGVAGTAALASLIYALVTPIFNSIFGDNRGLFHREFMKLMVINALTSISINYMTASKIDLHAMAWLPLLNFNCLASLCNAPLDIVAPIGGQLVSEFKDYLNTLGLFVKPGSGTVFLALNIRM